MANSRLKFRAWDERYEKMFTLEDALNNFEIYYQYTNRTYFKGNEHVKRFIHMQSTGLKDKNGKEIYEGDIMKIRESVCLVAPIGREGLNAFIDESISRFEVVGNIYANPDKFYLI